VPRDLAPLVAGPVAARLLGSALLDRDPNGELFVTRERDGPGDEARSIDERRVRVERPLSFAGSAPGPRELAHTERSEREHEEIQQRDQQERQRGAEVIVRVDVEGLWVHGCG
jgi:hypothetical protein